MLDSDKKFYGNYIKFYIIVIEIYLYNYNDKITVG